MSRIVGLFICALAAAAVAALVWGLSVRSYWVIAVPVALATLVFLALLFWIGLTLLTGEWAAPPPAPTRKDDCQ